MSDNGQRSGDVNVGSVLNRLNDISLDIGDLGAQLHRNSIDLEPVENWFEGYLGDYEAALLLDSKRMPSEKTRNRQCLRNLLRDDSLFDASGQDTTTTKADLGRRYLQLQAERERLKERIGNLKAEADAQRSVLSALKTEMEASH